MKYTAILLTLCITIAPATTQTINTRVIYVYNGIKITTGIVLLAIGSEFFNGFSLRYLINQSMKTKNWQQLQNVLHLTENELNQYQNASPEHTAKILAHHSKKRNEYLLGTVLAFIPGLALIIHGSKKIHEARTAKHTRN